MQTIQLDNLLLHPKAPSNSRGAYIVTDVEDWYSLPDSKTDFDERPQGHGAFTPGPDFRSSAVFTIKGWYNGSTRAECLLAKSNLNRVGRGPLVACTVTDEIGPTTRMISVRNVDITDDHGQTWFQFAIDCMSPDPRRYGTPGDVFKELPSVQGGNLAVNSSIENGPFTWTAQVDDTIVLVQHPADGGWRGQMYARLTVPAAAETLSLTSRIGLFGRNGAAHTVSLRVRSNASRSVRLTTSAFSSVMVYQTVTSEPMTIGTDWTEIALIDNPIPAQASQFSVTVDSLDGEPWNAGDWIDVDGQMIGLTVEYHDGDDEGWVWDGVPGQSSSSDLEQIKIVNDGTAPTVPVVTIVGGMPLGFTITEMETGRQIVFGKPVPDSATTVVDPNEGVVLVNGLPTYGLRKYGWPEVPAGSARHYMVTQPNRVPVDVTITAAPAWW